MSTEPLRLKSVFPPIPTPFDDRGQVAIDRLSGNIERWSEHDLAGFVVLGSNGEAPLLEYDEKLALIRAARASIASDRLLIAGTGCESTAATIALTAHAADAGADAALVITPSFYGGAMTPEVLAAHFEAVADASPIPVIVYNVPKFTGIDLDGPFIGRMSLHPNIVGVKDSSGNIAKLGDMVRLVEPGFDILAGTASFFLAALHLGASGGVLALANVAPAQCVELYALAAKGDVQQAAKLQRRLLPIDAAITRRFGVAGLKTALDLLGYYGGPCRPPLLPLADDEIKELRSTLIKGCIEL